MIDTESDPGAWADAIANTPHLNVHRADRNKGYSRGEERHSAKLTERDVLAIRVAHAKGDRLCDIAARYPQVSKVAVLFVITGRTWKYLLPKAEG